MISGAGLCWQHVGGVGSTTTTTTTSMETTFPPNLKQNRLTHFYLTTVSTLDILSNLLSSVNFYVTMTKFSSALPPNCLDTSYLDNTPSLIPFITLAKLCKLIIIIIIIIIMAVFKCYFSGELIALS